MRSNVAPVTTSFASSDQ